ncbi:O-methyltransferase [Candidatus Cyanaurora vandensis]|uniref:O-methyltransferase n=1 Tax=Candidatus Cyanaurora vandensis TaxID=2714958 RepID=UPI00257D429E|nr:O-methyltransferase [Candidatus Cyanaurora vandensis]
MADEFSRNAGTYGSAAIKAYLEGLYSPSTPALNDALAQLETMGMPQIQIAPTEGKLLALLLKLIGAKKVVELGTLSGYSGLWLAGALPEDGHLWTFEYDPKHAAVAQGVFQRAGLAQRVTVLVGAALANLSIIEDQAPFDAVFIDADKHNYGRYGQWALQHLRPGGLVIGDNAYLFGYLAGREPDSETSLAAIAGMRHFHELLSQHCEAVCIPTADGLAVGRKT